MHKKQSLQKFSGVRENIYAGPGRLFILRHKLGSLRYPGCIRVGDSQGTDRLLL